MDRKPSSFGPPHASLVGKDMICTHGDGQSAFTVPLIDTFMRRIMPIME
jgi:hypothetical protein